MTQIQIKKNFDVKSPGFITTVLSAILAIAAGIGIDFGSSPDQISNDLVSLFSTGGLTALFGYLVVNIVGPVWNFVKKKVPVNWKQILGSTTTIVSLAGIAVAALVYFWGINIPAETPSDVISAIKARNWALLASLAVANIVIPIVRYFKDLKKGVGG